MNPPSPRLQDWVAHWVIVAAPVVAFQAVPSPGAFRLAFALPLVYLVVAFCREPRARLPAWPMLLVAVIALSVSWGDDPTYSVQRLRTFLPLTLCFVVATSLCSSHSILLALRRSFATIIGISLVYVAASPAGRGLGDSGSIQGQFSKNAYAILLAFAVVLLLARKARSTVVLLPGLLLLIYLNYSVTAWFVSAALIVITVAGRVVVSRVGPRQGLPVLGVIAVVTALGIYAAIRALGSEVLAVVGKDPTLSERTDIWAASWQQIKQAPLLGHGAYTFLDSASNSPVTQEIWLQFTRYLPPHPHNGLLDLWGQLGLLGVAVFAGLVARGVWAAVRPAQAGSAPAVTALLGLAFVLLFGIAEPLFLGSYALLPIACVAMAEQARHELDTESSCVEAPSLHRLAEVST